jgi:hypothetical protein
MEDEDEEQEPLMHVKALLEQHICRTSEEPNPHLH